MSGSSNPPSTPAPGINSWLEDELFQQYQHDQRAVDASWKSIFERSNGSAGKPTGPAAPSAIVPAEQKSVKVNTPPTAVAVPNHVSVTGEQLVPLKGAAARIAENMTASLSIPTATSQRVMAVKVIDENRRIINEHRALIGKSKLSYTHLIAWAIVKAVGANPSMNHAYASMDGEGLRAVRTQLNLGLAVDIPGKDGTRSLKVPNIKAANTLSFDQFVQAYDGIVARARGNKLTVPDFEGTTISLTNPGTVGTLGSVPRLMPGQGAIVATGAIDYPAEYQGVSEEFRSSIGLSKVMMVTCTYDHRVIQGAESGMFLGRLQELLQGGHGFYEEIFAALHVPHRPVQMGKDKPAALVGARGGGSGEDVAKQAGVIQLVHAFRARGHLDADLNPLDAEHRESHPEVDPATYGLSMWDLDREFFVGTLKLAEAGKKFTTLRDIIETLRQTYCGKIGAEYMHIQEPEQKLWLQERMEPTRNLWAIEKGARLRALDRVLEAEEFEHFLHTRFIGHKRFSLEGAETAVAILDEILDQAANSNVSEAVIGMAHRGRLNILANIVGKSMVQVFSEFEGNVDPNSTQGSGDVKYHLGATGVRRSAEGKEITVSVAFNPSHLEAVDPVVEGIVRPKQDRMGDTERRRVIPILIHGDAAFAGQGVVMETLNLSQLDGYTTGGTIHLVINNQIGFTTNPDASRSSAYCTDIARMVQAPIFHVNGDDPEACLRVARMAYDFRQKFSKDVVIDMVCYRRHGHNEADDPSYTQPIMYRKIRQHPSVAVQYSERLIQEKLTDAAAVEARRKGVLAHLDGLYDESKKQGVRFQADHLSAVKSIEQPRPNTAIDRALIERIIQGITTFPDDFHLHPKLKGFIEKRKDALNGVAMDWAMGETLAFGSLVLEGTPVRLSGQDCGRGTFSQRHLDYYDSENGTRYTPLKHLDAGQAKFEVYDSSLSEYAVMGFEFGFSVADPLTLVLWEGQFGDFANGAQIMIDQFIASAESKWGQPSGLVLLLPHGYEGQGPEHSSGRMERFLTLCAEGNMQVVNASTPAQYFHLLRRQMYGGRDEEGVRKPLVVFTPKRMLRHPKAVSTITELITGGFHEVIGDAAGLEPRGVRRVVFCSGQLYYDLAQAREDRKDQGVALVRVEQLYPFPAAEVEQVLMRYPESAELVWAQEEPRNMGAWHKVEDSMRAVLGGRTLHYVGRAESASPAAGSLKRHAQEQAEIANAVFAPAMAASTPALALQAG